MHLKLTGDLGQIVPMEFSLPRRWSLSSSSTETEPSTSFETTDAAESKLRHLISRSNVVINLIGKEYETRNYTFEDVHVDIARRIAKISQEEGVGRLIHMSANGASLESDSAWLRSKAMGEEAVMDAFPSATIVRPTRLFGAEDRFLRSFAVTAKKLPIVPVVDGGNAYVQPVDARDVALAMMEMLKAENASEGKVYELGGSHVYRIKDLVKMVYETIREPDSSVPVPLPLMKLLGMPREMLLHSLPLPILSPSLFTLDEMVRLSIDDVISGENLGMEDLGIEPRKLEGVNLDYLRMYRQGGYDFGITAAESTAAQQRSG